jgi:hypothetical protein
MTLDELVRPKQFLGVLLKDWRRYRRALAAPASDYLALCNRNETLERAASLPGYRCAWQWTSELHAPKLFPSLGKLLMQRALGEHPINLAATPERASDSPDISFIIGHRGLARLPHLLMTLQSIAGQKGASCECLVVEQDSQPCLETVLPPWVRYIHTPPPAPDMPYCRSWAFNVAIRRSKGRMLVFHDNDMLVPFDYASRIRDHVDDGYEVINLKRFIFYLNEPHTQLVLSEERALTDDAPLSIVQNLEGGGSVAITRAACDRIGGFDESFIGWGGEDNEFWDRAQMLRVWPYAYLPIVHLWHPPQAGKGDRNNPTVNQYQALAGIPAADRITALQTQYRGETAGPVGWTPSG